MQEHEQEQERELGHDHGHSHGHGHTHDHDHARAPIMDSVAPEERTRALLAYMIEHNEHHTSELSELTDSLNGAARERLLEAIRGFGAANARLREVLELIKGE